MKRWMSTTLPWFLSVSLHAGVLFVLAGTEAHAHAVDSERAAVWAGNTFEVDTLSERVEDPKTPSLTNPPALPPPEPTASPEPEARSAATPEPPVEAAPEPEVRAPQGAHAARDEPSGQASEPSHAPEPTASSEAAASKSSEPAAAAAQAAPAAVQTADHVVEPVYGEAVAKPPAVSLAKALTRACPRAAFPDKAWHKLPLGPAGKIEFAIELDDHGQVVRATRKKNPAEPPPAYLLRLVQRTTRMLKAGVFAMATGRVEAGVQRFEVSAQVEQQAASDSVLAEPEDLRQIGRFVEPTPTRPGKADFTYNSGRHVILTLRMSSD